MIAAIFTLLLLYQLKHFLADYPLQRPWMLGKFLPGIQFAPPLAAHCAVHGLMTFGIAYWFSGDAWLALALAAFDFSAHFVMDRIKASPKWMGRWKPLTAPEYMECQRTIKGCGKREYDCGDLLCDAHHSTCYQDGGQCWHDWEFVTAAVRKRLRSNRLFWHSIGFDQMIHHLTHYTIIYALVRSL